MDDILDFLFLKPAGVALVFFSLIAIAIVGVFVCSYYEAQAFNRITGKNVSMYDAMWVDLRVQSEASD